MSTATALLAQQYRTSYGAARMNLRGIGAEEAHEVPEGRGSSANWITGHVVAMRGPVHRLLGIAVVEGTDGLEAYARGTAVPDEASATEQRLLLRMWKESQAAIEIALAAASDDDLSRSLDAPDPLLGETVGSALAFFAFHEAYHVGQIGMTRRRLGMDGAIT